MVISNINNLNSSFLINKKSEQSSEISFSEVLKSSRVTSDTNRSHIANSTGSTPQTYNKFQAKMTTGILPSGQAYTSYNIEDNLTDSDKAYLKSLGWPTAEFSNVNFLAGYIAQDRIDGTLKGPLTKEYFVGGKDNGFIGLLDRLPEMGSELKALYSTLMAIVDSRETDAAMVKEASQRIVW